MRKRVAGYQLNRDTNARKALFKGLVSALVLHESIDTTKAKANAVQSIFEKMLTHAKRGEVRDHRVVQSYVQDSAVVKKLVSDIAPRYKEIRSGYTKIIAIGNRRGDNAPMVRLLLTHRVELAKKGSTKDEKVKGEAKKANTKAETPKVLTPKVAKPTKAMPVAESKGMIGARRGER